ncbi:MAG: SpaA isopeptide-forming pilin-related protein [Myxococcaceae bacterium]
MRLPAPQLVVSLLTLTACDCGNPRLSIHEGTPPDAGPRASACGNGFLELPFEECDFGIESNTGGPAGACNPDCFLSRACPVGQRFDEARVSCVAEVDAGAVDAGAAVEDAGVGAKVVGVLVEYPGALFNSVLHPDTPIAGAIVHLRRAGSSRDLATFTTQADGRFEFDLAPGGAYQLVDEVPPDLYNEANPRPVPVAAAGQTVRADARFLRKGVSFVVRTLATSMAIDGVQVTVMAPGNRVLAGPRQTDAEGFVHFPPTSERGTMVFEKPGFRRYELGMPSVDTTSTVIGGCGLEVQ